MLAALDESINIKHEKEQQQLDRKVPQELVIIQNHESFKRWKKEPVNNSNMKKIKTWRTLWEPTKTNLCSGLYVGYDDEPTWIQCGECDLWFHVKCTYLDPDIDVGESVEIEFFCQSCL